MSNPPLIVYTDIKSPYAYLAKDLIYALEDELGIEADWRHFTLDIPSYLGAAQVDDSGKVLEETRSEHQWKRVKYAYMDVRRYANLRELTIRGTQKIWDTSLAGIGLYWAKQFGQNTMRAYLDSVFEPFWKRELDVEDHAVIAGKLKAAGADINGFEAYAREDGLALHNHLRDEAWALGVFGVPTFRLADDEIFFGREQLDFVRYRLTEGKSTVPK